MRRRASAHDDRDADGPTPHSLIPLYFTDDGVSQLFRFGLTTEVGRPVLPRCDDALDGTENAIVHVAVAQMIRHHCPRPDGADWIGHALARDVRGRPVNRLEHRRVSPLGVDVRSRSDAEAAR